MVESKYKNHPLFAAAKAFKPESRKTTVEAPQCILELIETQNQMNYRFDYLCRRMSEIDKLIVDMEHYLELSSIPTPQVVKLSFKFRAALRERRAVKDEHTVLMNFRSKFNNKPERMKDELDTNLKGLQNRKYTPRQKTLEEILGE